MIYLFALLPHKKTRFEMYFTHNTYFVTQNKQNHLGLGYFQEEREFCH